MGVFFNNATIKTKSQTTSSAFTIVELLIVVVVISILAAVTIVAYSGITAQARESSLKSELSTIARKIEAEKIRTESYPSSIAGYQTVGNLVYNSTDVTFCISGVVNGISYYIASDTGVPQEGMCPPASMQQFTAAQCSSLPVYTGSNPEAIITLEDPRGAAQTYEVARLADDNCWMLDNLRLGSTTSTTTLTPLETNIINSFELSRVVSPGNSSSDASRVYGPVTGDTGDGDTNYGYLYNWPAATAGETRTTATVGSVAPYSICPAGWRLPTSGPSGDFAWLSARMYNPAATEPMPYQMGNDYSSNWYYTGQFKGVLAGFVTNIYNQQEDTGYIWSSMTSPSYDTQALSVRFYDNAHKGVDPRAVINRNYGAAIRCLLNQS